MTTAQYDKAPVIHVIDFGNRDPGAGSDIDMTFAIPSGYEGRLVGAALTCTETYAGAANTALHIGTEAGGTQICALAIDAAGGDAFTAGDVWSVVFRDGVTPSGAVAAAYGAPGNAVTSVTNLVLAEGATYFVSLQGGTGTLTAGQHETVVTLELRQV